MAYARIDRDEFTALWEGPMTVDEIAAHLSVSRSSVLKARARFDLPYRKVQRDRPDHVVEPVPADPVAAERLARRCDRLRKLHARGDLPVPPGWPPERDVAVLRTGGAYAALHALAVRLAVPFDRLLARWHVVRVV